MVIEVRFFASLRRYTPSEPSGILSVDVSDELTVDALLYQLEVEPSHVACILLNGKEANLASPLFDGDRLELFPPNGSKFG